MRDEIIYEFDHNFVDAIKECSLDDKKALFSIIGKELSPNIKTEDAKGHIKALCILRDFLILCILHGNN